MASLILGTMAGPCLDHDLAIWHSFTSKQGRSLKYSRLGPLGLRDDSIECFSFGSWRAIFDPDEAISGLSSQPSPSFGYILPKSTTRYANAVCPRNISREFDIFRPKLWPCSDPARFMVFLNWSKSKMLQTYQERYENIIFCQLFLFELSSSESFPFGIKSCAEPLWVLLSIYI